MNDNAQNLNPNPNANEQVRTNEQARANIDAPAAERSPEGFKAEVKTDFSEAANALRAGIDKALGDLEKDVPRVSDKALPALESLVETFLPPAVRGYVSGPLALGVHMVEDAIGGPLDAKAIALLELAKKRLDAVSV